ncbi:MAG TPA: NAD(P)/FAD-dependent oxidoreductase [Jatrophihabitans sp.]|jgi:thioredoxin reductase|uniref:NAD(P)/FAD-dependent oxidoreductase n=1 Tax=Jatrophihabitans sp. TaxID=1932789 RepID=UPI002DF92009|nr:NAD(P)/FAD-dependent oxidoreductase [Jatrophihabitans sp.]
MSEFDVVVIGGGAAGLSAALVLSRARRSVLVVDGGAPRNAPAAHMHGFLSRDGLPPADLLAIGRAEVTGYGATVVDGVVTGVAPSGSAGFGVTISTGDRVVARRLLIATGLRDELPDIPGLRERWGRDVLHCPYCHGYEVRDRRLAVIGRSPDAVRYAQIVRQWSDDVVLVAPTGIVSDTYRTQLAARGIAVREGDVTSLRIDAGRLTAVAIDGARDVRCDAVFVPPRPVPNNALLLALGCALDADGWVVVGPDGHAGVPGVWVAGNLANPRAQVITAAGEGSAAAIAINADLVDDDVRLSRSPSLSRGS